MIWNIFVLLGTLGITVVTLWQVSTKITHRIKVKVDELAALTKGEINHTLTQDRRDLHEIKAITRGLEDLQSQLQTAASAKEALQLSEAAQQQVVQSLTNGLNQLAAGDLTARIAERFDPKYQGLADNFNVAATALSDLVARVIETANGILSGARGISEATTELSQRTETQGVTLQNAAGALEELTRNIIGSQSDATELDGLASLASDKGVAMGVTMAKSVSAIEAIKSSSQQIEQIVGVIEDIAFQTNLLALNAGVEATRAGAEGSGFAVIASEVRGLAERSAQSAQDIKSLIAASGLEVAKGVEYVAEAEASAGDIGAHIQKISGIISRIAVAASEQSQGLVKVNDGVSKLDLVTQTNVAMVEETTAECASLTAVAQDLSQLVSHFQIAQSKTGGFNFPAQAA
jgi:methyl-accepting chemotaxis protein